MVYKYCLKNDEIILQSLRPDCTECAIPKFAGSKIKKCPAFGRQARIGYIEGENGYCFICSFRKDHTRSAKQYKAYIDLRLEVMNDLLSYREVIKSAFSDDFGRLLHNLTSLNGHNTQELYALVPQELATHNLRNCMAIIRKRIASDTLSAAKLFFQLQKNCSAIKTEFDVFKKLYHDSPVISNEPHAIHPVILNILYVFFQDFNDKHIYVTVKETTDWVFIDYETIRVAFYHLFQNAEKYVCPDTEIFIEFDRSDPFLEISMNMISLKITDTDMNRLFEDKYSGELARELNLNGEGRGMSIVKKAVELNNGEIRIQRDVSFNNRKVVDETEYVNNIFTLKLYRSKSSARQPRNVNGRA